MSYQVKEIYYTLQGEGARTGRAAVFLRFAGCNLWSGREKDRAAAVCTFCDTDFVGTDGPGGGSFGSAEELADAVTQAWLRKNLLSSEAGEGRGAGKPYIVCTGGEPLLQLDAPLIAALHARDFEIAIESNGTIPAPAGIDWICVSPKAEAELKLARGNELKLVYPQALAPPERLAHLAFDHFFLQPMDGAEREANTRAAIQYCLAHPQWRLSLQTHKLIGIP
jgi:7-carboxy-7-deazaguanine synthase (Cx14CxxC type)